jgi:hypothetical protein
VSEDQRVSAAVACGSGWRTCFIGEPGFRWSDVLTAATVERVVLTFQMGYDCEGGTRTGELNGGAPLPYAGIVHCACTQPPDRPTTLIVPGTDYLVADDNTFLSTNPPDCLGFDKLRSGPAVGNWAEVCVYATCMCVFVVV